MLNDDSIPVWMLADSLLALLITGALSCVAILPLAIRHANSSNDAVEHNSSAAALSETQHALFETQTQVRQLQATEQALLSEKQTLQQTAAKQDAEIRRLNQLAESTRQATSKLQVQLTGLQRTSATEKSVRQELLGLKGKMDRTVFVIDISASMANEFTADFTRANWQSGENAWSNVQRKIRDYLEMLPVQSFRIVCFNHALQEFPADTATWSTDRQAAMDFLGTLTPEGITNTEQALRKAATFHPSSIILFTDGQPTMVSVVKSDTGTDQSTAVFDVDQQLRILAMPASGIIQCPVNVIALNDYASQPAAADASTSARTFLAFLQELAGRSGGAFLGY